MSAARQFRIAIAVAACLAATWLAGCGPSPSSSVQQPLNEVRGAPIKKIVAKVETPPREAMANPSTNAALSSSSPLQTLNAGSGASTPTKGNSGIPLALSFEQLSGYTFEVNDELLGPVTNDLAAATQKTNAKIPEKIKSFDQKKVALRGFMLPLKVEGGLVTEMLIMKDQSMCCYGTTPRINDWVSVRMKNKGVRPFMDLPVTLYGTMRIGEMRENGYLVGIYSMDGENLEVPESQ